MHSNLLLTKDVLEAWTYWNGRYVGTPQTWSGFFLLCPWGVYSCNINSGKPPNVTIMTLVVLKHHRIILRFYFITKSYFIITWRYLNGTTVHRIFHQRVYEGLHGLERNNEAISKFQMDPKLIWSLRSSHLFFFIYFEHYTFKYLRAEMHL